MDINCVTMLNVTKERGAVVKGVDEINVEVEDHPWKESSQRSDL